MPSTIRIKVLSLIRMRFSFLLLASFDTRHLRKPLRWSLYPPLAGLKKSGRGGERGGAGEKERGGREREGGHVACVLAKREPHVNEKPMWINQDSAVQVSSDGGNHMTTIDEKTMNSPNLLVRKSVSKATQTSAII